MRKLCKCGSMMDIRLRTVVYQNKVEIDNVPIYSCDACGHSEVMATVKPELTGLIGTLGNEPDKRKVSFEDMHELAHLLYAVSDKERLYDSVEMIVEERINELLDLLLIAQSLKDEAWLSDVRRRLSQITNQTLSI